jgi:hypothetical protein
MIHWFAAVLVIRSRVGAGWDDDPLLDCQLRLLESPTAEDAYRRALELGKAEEHVYQNQDGEDVQWEFLGLHDLRQLDDPPASGTEVYSWMTRDPDTFQVVPKDRLTAFWVAGNSDKNPSELLEE